MPESRTGRARPFLYIYKSRAEKPASAAGTRTVNLANRAKTLAPRPRTAIFRALSPVNNSTKHMIKSILSIIAISSLLSVPAFSKTMKLPSDEFPFASITMPDDWEPEEINNGAAGESPDKAVYMSAVAVGNEKGMESELDDTFAMLEEHKVEFDKSSKKENKFQLNGVDVEELIFHGKDEDGPCSISISFIPIKDKVVVLTYWVTTAKEEQHSKEVAKILQSLKAEK
jgi:hypothetical protein